MTTTPVAPPDPPFASVYQFDATVLHWVDGDTVDLRVYGSTDVGFRFNVAWSFDSRFRLYGVDTPERGQLGYEMATQHNRFLAAEGSDVRIETFKPLDKYGRWLARVWVVEAGGSHSDLAQLLIEAGLGVPYFGGTKTS